MTEPPFRLARHPPGRPRGDPDFQVFADWITEDVIQRLYASRQDIAEALADAPILAFDPDLLLCRLLVIIDNLRQIAKTMTADPDACPSTELFEQLAEAVAVECENARALVTEGAALLARDERIRAETARLTRDAAALRSAIDRPPK